MDATNAGCILRLGECMEATGNPQEAEDLSLLHTAQLPEPGIPPVRAHAQAHLASVSGGSA